MNLLLRLHMLRVRGDSHEAGNTHTRSRKSEHSRTDRERCYSGSNGPPENIDELKFTLAREFRGFAIACRSSCELVEFV